MEYLIIQGLYGLDLGQTPIRVQVDEYFEIFNDRDVLVPLVEHYLRPVLNSAQISELLGARAFAIDWKLFKEPQVMSEDDIEHALRNFVVREIAFSTGLWAIRDNAITTRFAYFVTMTGAGPPRGTYDFSGLKHSMAGRDIEWVSYSENEVNEAWAIGTAVTDLIPGSKPDSTPLSSLTENTRFGRSVSFLQAARSNNDLAIKIAFYCMSFEALVSTDRTGVTHQVSERVALLVGETAAERRTIYADMKRLYELRSSAVHGDDVKFKVDDSDKARIRAGDEYLRRIVHHIVATPTLAELFSNAKKEAVTAHFMNLLFPTN